MKILELTEKNPFQRGVAHGSALKNEIQWLHTYFYEYMRSARGKLSGLLQGIVAEKALSKRFFIPYDYLQEMQGVAQGAGVPYSFIRLVNTIDDIRSVYACSSCAVETRDGWIAASNLDYGLLADAVAKNLTVFIYRSSNDIPFISVAFPGYIGMLRGINEKGTFLASHTSRSRVERKAGISCGILYRMMLELNRFPYQGMELLYNSDRTIGNNVLYGSRTMVAVLECDTGEIKMRESETNGRIKFITATNHFQQKEMRPRQRPRTVPHGTTLPPFYFTDEYSIARDEYMRYAINLYQEIETDFDFSVLRVIMSQPPLLYVEKDNPHSTENITSVLFDPLNRAIGVTDNAGKLPGAEGQLKIISFNFKI